MWSTEYRHDTDVPADVLWSTWVRVVSGDLELDGGDRFEPHGPLEEGARISMTPEGQDRMDVVVVRWQPPLIYADRAVYQELELTFTHSFLPTDTGSTLVIRLDVEGPRADAVGPELGPQISADFPREVDSLVRAARVAM